MDDGQMKSLELHARAEGNVLAVELITALRIARSDKAKADVMVGVLHDVAAASRKALMAETSKERTAGICELVEALALYDHWVRENPP